MRGQKHNEGLKEKALALLATNNSLTEVSKQLHVSVSTLQTWRNKHQDDAEFVNLRKKKKEEFVNNAWVVIENAQELLKRRLERALNSEDEIDQIVEEINQLEDKELTQEQRKALYRRISAIKVEDVGKIATVLGTLYDKQALVNNEPTGRVEVQLEDLLRKVEGKSEY